MKVNSCYVSSVDLNNREPFAEREKSWPVIKIYSNGLQIGYIGKEPSGFPIQQSRLISSDKRAPRRKNDCWSIIWRTDQHKLEDCPTLSIIMKLVGAQ